MDYMSPLNDQQREAVLHFGSPLLILAGAGSGKTRVITTKIAYLIDEKGFDPMSILAVTFTNKAASEMKNRVTALTERGEAVMVRTFHSFGAWMLRRYAEPAGLKPNFTIYDEDDKLALIKSLNEKPIPRSELKILANLISRAKDNCLTPGDNLRDLTLFPGFQRLYEQYERKLGEMGNVDFGDLILKPLILLHDRQDIRSRLCNRFQVILVDEFQDSNGAQLELLKLLYDKSNYLCVVGDEDQSIYSFRGALVENIVEFPNMISDTKVIMLERNYRSTKRILSLAQAVVSNNKYRLGKNLWTEGDEGNPVTFSLLTNQDEEALYCSRILSDGNYEGTAVLYRNNYQSRAFESVFTRMQIPYRIIGTLKFYEREEVKDVISYLRFIVNPRDEVSFKRIVNKPTRGIGEKSIRCIIECKGQDLLDSCRISLETLSKKAREGVEYFIRVIADVKTDIETRPLKKTLALLIKRSGLKELYANHDETNDTSKLDNLNELLNAVAQYGKGMSGLEAFLEATVLNSSDEDPYASEAKVTLITMHNTKGLEFDRVIITGLEEGLFPHSRNELEENESGLEEERRLFYVAVTRARKTLYLTSCMERLVFGEYADREVSRFVDEIPDELLDHPGRRKRDAGFRRGDSIVHGKYGEGVVTNAWINEGEEFVLVRFRDGRSAQFMPQYTKLRKIGNSQFGR